jgi:hypothetical protein
MNRIIALVGFLIFTIILSLWLQTKEHFGLIFHYPDGKNVQVNGMFDVTGCERCKYTKGNNKMECMCKDNFGSLQFTSLSNISKNNKVNNCNGKLIPQTCRTDCNGAGTGNCITCDDVKAAFKAKKKIFNREAQQTTQQCLPYHNRLL